MSMSPPPVGGPSPASDSGNTNDAEQTGNTEEVKPAAAKEASGTVGGLPRRTPNASGAHQPERRYGTFAAPPSVDHTLTSAAALSKLHETLKGRPLNTSAEDATTPEPPGEEPTTPDPTEA